MMATWEVIFALAVLVVLFARLEGVPVIRKDDEIWRQYNVIAFWVLLAIIIVVSIASGLSARPMPGTARRRSNEYSW